MDEIDRAIVALHTVDTELDDERVLDRTRAHYLGAPGSTLVIPLTETPRRPLGSRPRPASVWIAAAAVTVAVCVAALAAPRVWPDFPERDGASTPASIEPTSSVTRRPAPSPTSTSSGAEALARAVSAATSETSCGQAHSPTTGRRYLLRLSDGTWTLTSDDTAPAGGEQPKVDELVLDALMHLLTHPDEYEARTDGYAIDGFIEIDVIPAEGMGLAGLVLLVDPVHWRPVSVISQTVSGTHTTIETTWGHECPAFPPATQ